MKTRVLIIIAVIVVISLTASVVVYNNYLISYDSLDLRGDVSFPEHVKEEILEELRKTPREESMQNFTDTARSFVVSETLNHPQVWNILKDYTYITKCCSFSVDNDNPELNDLVSIKYDVNEKYLFVTVTYELKQGKVVTILTGSSSGIDIIPIENEN